MSFSEVYLDLMAFKFSKVRSNISFAFFFMSIKTGFFLMNLPLSNKPVKHLVFCKSLTNVYIGIDGNKLTQLWNIARYFYLCLRRCAVNSLLFKIFLGMLYKNRIKEQAFECYLY